MHSVGSINIPLLLGIIIALGAFFLVDTNISIHALDKEELVLYDYVELAQFADTIKDGDKEIEEISMKLMESSNSFSTSAPDTDTSAPDTDTSAPDTDTSAPDTDTSAPDTDTSAPDTDTSAPDTDTSAPDTDTSAPDTDTSAPDTDTSAPDTDTSAPDTDTSAPDTDTSAPDTDTSAPDTDTSAPDTDTSAPDTDTSAPDTDTSAPDTDTSAPDTDTSAPDTDTSAPDTDTSAPDTDTSAPDDEENILINQLVKSGKFTEDEATEFVIKVMKNGTNGASTADDTLDSDLPATSESDTSTNETPMTSETDNSTNDTTSSDNQNIDDESSSNTNNPEEYDDLNGLVDDIKNGDIDTDEISLDAFQDSGAYHGTDKETQDCIDLAGKIGQNLGDSEIVHCFDDANYFRDKYQVSVPQDNVPQPIPEPEPTMPETNTTQQVTEPKPEPEPTMPESNTTQQVTEPKPEPEPTMPESNTTQQVTEPIPEPNVAEEYDQLEDLVDDIKNGDLDDDEILLNDFIDSGAYQDANKNIQDCIRLAGKIGQNLGDSEIVHCFDDANYFRDKYP